MTRAVHASVSTGADSNQSLSTGSFTPPANSRLYFSAVAMRANHTEAFSWASPGGDLTWTAHAESSLINFGADGATYAIQLKQWYVDIGASPSAVTLTAGPGSASGAEYISAVAWSQTNDEFNTGSPYPQVAVVNGGTINPVSDSASGSVSLGSAPASGNLQIAVVATGCNSAGGPSAPTGFGALGTPQTQEYTNVGVFTRTGSTAQAAAVADLGTQVGNWAAIIFEVAAAAPPTQPTITDQPDNVTATQGSTAQFTVAATASAGSLTYQWQHNGTGSFANIDGATSASYTTPAVAPSITGRQYRCVVTDSNGSVNSSAATLTVTALAAPTNFALDGQGGTAGGIAAGYPGDVGISGHPAVLWADDFESYANAAALTSGGAYSNQFGTLAIDTAQFISATKSLRIRMPASGTEVSNGLVKPISPTQDTLYVRVYQRYQAGYQGVGSAHNGIRITANYSGPGTIPDGTDFMYVGIESSRYQGEAEPGYVNAYVYHPEQDDNYGEHWYPSGLTSNGSGPNGGFGGDFVSRSNAPPALGTWECYEVMVKLNAPGQRDGRVTVWVDGTIIADWGNIRFRDVNTVKIDEIQLENGGQSSSQQNDKWYDSLVVATSYIGPRVAP